MDKTPPLVTLPAVALIVLLASPAAAAPKFAEKSRLLAPGKALKASWKLSPYTCALLRVSAQKPRAKRPRGGGVLAAFAADKPRWAPLSGRLADGKVLHRLKGEGAPISRRLCSGSNGIRLSLSVRSPVRATVRARLTPHRLRLVSGVADPGRRAWAAAATLWQTDPPDGHPRVLLSSGAGLLGPKSAPLGHRLNLAKGRCYRVQLWAEEAGALRLTARDPDGEARLEQTLRPKARTPLTSDPICPKATEAHRLELTAVEGPRRAVAYRLVDRSLGTGPAIDAMRITTGSPEQAPCLNVRARRSPRLVCGGALMGASTGKGERKRPKPRPKPTK